jgi:NADH-quinone oxidoreductase subunit H
MATAGTIMPIFYVLIFPGFVFLVAFGLMADFVDRKLVARMQSRVGPPWYQPVADLFKLLSKEDIVTEDADRSIVNLVPVFGLASVATAFLYVPMWTAQWPFSFTGDIIAVVYLLTLPAFVLVLLGWYSPNPYGAIGTGRVITQLFGYEVPFTLALLTPAIGLQSWRITDILAYQQDHMWLIVTMPVAFYVAVVGLVGKLERIPFDIPHAECEIVEGPMTEYTGRKLAMLKLMLQTEMVVGGAIIAVFFLGGPYLPGIDLVAAMGATAAHVIGFFVMVVKILLVVFILSVIKAIFARLRIEQMVQWCLTWLAIPILLQILIVILFGTG